jgi:methionyl-tRNA synthetase
LAGKLGGILSGERHQSSMEETYATVNSFRAAFEKWEFRQGVRAVVELGEKANKFIQETKPWEKVSTSPEEARRDLSTVVELAYWIAAMMAPVVPKISAEICNQLAAPLLNIKDLDPCKVPLLPANHRIGVPKPIAGRLEEKVVEQLIVTRGESKPAANKNAQSKTAKPKKGLISEPPAQITYDDFAKLDIRVGKVLAAQKVPESDKLLKLAIDLGESEPRCIVAGIAESYHAEQVVAKRVAVIANLAPRTIRGIESRGMLMAAGESKNLTLVEVPGELLPGTKIQ